MTTLTRLRGDTYPYQVVLRRKSDRTLVDLSGSIITWSVSADRESGTPSYLFQTVGTLVDAENGQVNFIFDEDKADNIGTFFYDVQILSAGEIRTIDRGTITFKQDITKTLALLEDEFGNLVIDELGNNLYG